MKKIIYLFIYSLIINSLFLFELNTNGITDFNDLIKKSNSLIGEIKIQYGDKFLSDFSIIDDIKCFCLYKNLFIIDCWNYCKENPSEFDSYFILQKSKELELTENQSIDQLLLYFFTTTY